MIKKTFSEIQVVKTRLGEKDSTTWGDLFDTIAINVRDFIVSQIGWEIQEQEQIEFVDGYGIGPIVLSRENLTALAKVEVFDGSDYVEITPKPRFFNHGVIDYALPDGYKIGKITYTAGFKIDFEHRNDDAQHTLPGDIEELSNRLISKIFLNKQNLGEKSRAFESGSTVFASLLEPVDIAIIKKYKRTWT